jgi:hypothetical protein
MKHKIASKMTSLCPPNQGEYLLACLEGAQQTQFYHHAAAAGEFNAVKHDNFRLLGLQGLHLFSQLHT